MSKASAKATAKVSFLGGVGEVGRNMAVLELEGRRLIIDCGLSFPHDEMPGIDIVLPDFEYLRAEPERIEAVALTHGHEDHIGAVPYLFREFGQFPVYGTPFTLALLRRKLDEHKVLEGADLREVNAGEAATTGPFSMRFLQVTHSIPDGVAIAVDTPHGVVLHTGDFRLDQTPLDGRATDLLGLAAEATRGVHLLLSDSTNAEDPGTIPSERVVGPVLKRIVEETTGLAVLACFSSHIHRVQQAADAARASNRVVAFLGRSMLSSTAAARELGLLHIPDDDIVPIEEVAKLDPAHVAIICTGSQGEPMAALSLIASREHKWVKLKQGDAVVLSSSLIPGNEPAIHRVVDGLYRTGAEVYHMPSDKVHVSGHAAADELQFLLNLVKPRWFTPVHGERRHLSQHARLAREVGIPAERILVAEDGDTIEIGADFCRFGDRVPAGMTFVDGSGIGDVGREVLRDRRKLAEDGIVVVVVTVDAHNGDIVGEPDIANRGFIHEDTSAEILDEARDRVMAALEEIPQDVTDRTVLAAAIRRVLGRYFYDVTKRKPVIVPIVIEV